MPTTLAGSMAAVLLLAAAAAFAAAATRRWGTGRAPDPLALAGRAVLRGFGRAVEAVAAWAAGIRDVRTVRRLQPAFETSGVLYASEPGRRGLFRRRRDEQAGEPSSGAGATRIPGDEDTAVAPQRTEPPPATEGGEPPRQRPRPPLDHVPLEPERRDAGGDAAEERLRDRWRRGLRKTRDYLNRDVREVFGPGPVPEAFDDLEDVLVRADVGVVTATALADELRERGRELTSDTLPDALRDAMRASLREADRRLTVNTSGVSVWLVVGVNGTGKTTSCAKLAGHAARQGFKVCLAAGDTFRAAAGEQLQTWGERLGIDVVRQHAGADPAAVVFDAIDHARARGFDLVIVDTAGRLHNRSPLMDELRKVRRVVDREEGMLTETLLVLDATTGQNGIAQARAFREAVDVTGLVLAKLDGTAKGGIVFAVERELGIPVKAVGIGEGADDLAPFDPDEFVDALFASS